MPLCFDQMPFYFAQMPYNIAQMPPFFCPHFVVGIPPTPRGFSEALSLPTLTFPPYLELLL